MKKNEMIWWLYFGGIGFAIGLLIMGVWREQLLYKSGFLDAYALGPVKYLKIHGNEIFWYVCKERVGSFLGIVLLSTTYLGVAVCAILAVWMGAAAGMFLSAAVLRYGVKGLILIFLAMFPQQIVLIPAFLLLFQYSYNLCCKIYYPGFFREPYYGSNKQYYMKIAIKDGVLLLVVIIGCLLESYVNPVVMSAFLNVF